MSFSPMERGTFDDVPLRTLFPQSDPGDLERMRRAAGAVDAMRPPVQQPPWGWFSRHGVFSPPPFPEIEQVILLATITIEPSPSDWLEFELDVSWTSEGALCASAAVSVACWCHPDHGTHYLDPLTVAVGGDISLGQAFEAAADRVVSWLENPRDASWWRARADLPSA